MTVRKILGSIKLPQGNHSVAKLDNGCYAVGNISYGRHIPDTAQYPDLDTAFTHWREALYNVSSVQQ